MPSRKISTTTPLVHTPWTDEEIAQLQAGIKLRGKRWETITRSIAGRNPADSKQFYLAYIESGHLEEYKKMRDEGMSGDEIMSKASALPQKPTPRRTGGAGKQKRGPGRPPKKKVSRKRKSPPPVEKSVTPPLTYHSDEEVVVVGQDTDDIMFHQSSTSYSTPTGETQPSDKAKQRSSHPPSAEPSVDEDGDVHNVTVADPVPEEPVEPRAAGNAVVSASRNPSSSNGRGKRKMGSVPTDGPNDGGSMTGMYSHTGDSEEDSDEDAMTPTTPSEMNRDDSQKSRRSSQRSTMRAPNNGFCYCKQEHSHAFFVACESCSRWYHGNCVGVDPNYIARLEKANVGYHCTQCRIAREHGATVYRDSEGEWRLRSDMDQDGASGNYLEQSYADQGSSAQDEGHVFENDPHTRKHGHDTRNVSGKLVYVTRFCRQTASLRARRLLPTEYEQYQEKAQQQRFFTRIGWPHGSVPGPVQGVPYGGGADSYVVHASPRAAEPHSMTASARQGMHPASDIVMYPPPAQMTHYPSVHDRPPSATYGHGPVVPMQHAPPMTQGYPGGPNGGYHSSMDPGHDPTKPPRNAQYMAPVASYPSGPPSMAPMPGDLPPLICVPHFIETVPTEFEEEGEGVTLGPLQNPPGAIMQHGDESFEGSPFKPCEHRTFFPCANLTANVMCHWHHSDRTNDVTDPDKEPDDARALLHHVQLQSQREVQRYHAFHVLSNEAQQGPPGAAMAPVPMHAPTVNATPYDVSRGRGPALAAGPPMHAAPGAYHPPPGPHTGRMVYAAPPMHEQRIHPQHPQWAPPPPRVGMPGPPPMHAQSMGPQR
eukprot:m.182625 g.182625  ORF g.182625 m.182625 type:complete len:819 (-) comp15582_c0_seq1:274-2730(-)